MTTTLADVTRTVGASAPARPAERMRRVARRWRYATDAGAAVLSAFLVLWTITPLYNMVMVSLEAEGDVYSTTSLPPQTVVPAFGSFTQDFWYLEHFWHQFGNSAVYRLRW